MSCRLISPLAAAAGPRAACTTILLLAATPGAAAEGVGIYIYFGSLMLFLLAIALLVIFCLVPILP